MNTLTFFIRTFEQGLGLKLSLKSLKNFARLSSFFIPILWGFYQLTK